MPPIYIIATYTTIINAARKCKPVIKMVKNDFKKKVLLYYNFVQDYEVAWSHIFNIVIIQVISWAKREKQPLE